MRLSAVGQGAVADHLGEPMHHPAWVAPVFDASGKAFGDLEPLLDRRQQQDTSIRSEPPAIKGDMHRLARHGWQTRQNPRTVIHGGRELRCPRLIRSCNQIIHESNGLCRSRQPSHATR
jgi:hypothetical protein